MLHAIYLMIGYFCHNLVEIQFLMVSKILFLVKKWITWVEYGARAEGRQRRYNWCPM